MMKAPAIAGAFIIALDLEDRRSWLQLRHCWLQKYFHFHVQCIKYPAQCVNSHVGGIAFQFTDLGFLNAEALAWLVLREVVAKAVFAN